MTNPEELFTYTLMCTGGLYAVMLAYFNGLVDTKRPNTRILWNSEPIFWFITALLMVFLIFRLVGPEAGAQGPGLWYTIGAGNLIVIYTYLIFKLARHDLPETITWVVAGLIAIAILNAIFHVIPALLAARLGLDTYAAELGNLLAWLTHIVLLILAFLLVRSLWSSVMLIWSAEAKSQGRLTAGGVAVFTTGSVTNPSGALSDINKAAGTKPESEWAIVYPQSCLTIDFGGRRLEDHGFRSDLRIVRANTEQAITVEVSNDLKTWQECFRDEKISGDWDVPYYSNPWRYVRICNRGDQPTQIGEVYDLD